MLYHFYFAKVVSEKLNFDYEKFAVGAILPDLASDKSASHFQNETRSGLKIPDLHAARKAAENIADETLRAGVFSHLYLDRRFITEFLIPKFTWDWDAGKITSVENGREFSPQEFFSPAGLYRGYGEVNRVLLRREFLKTSEIDALEEWPPETGVKVFDARRAASWRDEVWQYLSGMREYTGEIFRASELIRFIRKAADDFAKDEVT